MRQLWKARGDCVCVCELYENWLMNTGVKDAGLLELVLGSIVNFLENAFRFGFLQQNHFFQVLFHWT